MLFGLRRKMAGINWLLAALFLLSAGAGLIWSVTGCHWDHDGVRFDWDDDDCDEEIDRTRDRYGEPDEIESRHSDDERSLTYIYRCRGFSKTFRWGRHIVGCETRTRTFEPDCD